MGNNIKLIKPSENLKEEYLNMLREWNDFGEELNPWSLQVEPANFENMVETLMGYERGVGLPDGFVPVSVFWLIDGNKRILGAVDIRHRLNGFLEHRGGHIGYGIRPSQRRKGYATVLLNLALKECETLGIQRVLITCRKNNTGSVKTILHNGGVLESEDTDCGEVFQRYWISL